MRTCLRRPAAVGEPGTAARLMTRKPFVASRAGDAIPLAQLSHRPVAALEIVYEREPFLDDIRFHPGHPPGVNDVPGLVLTMTPVCTPCQLTANCLRRSGG